MDPGTPESLEDLKEVMRLQPSAAENVSRYLVRIELEVVAGRVAEFVGDHRQEQSIHALG